MEAMEAILTRRSIRKYEARLVDESIQRELLNAAMNAPSSSNGQPYVMTVNFTRYQFPSVFENGQRGSYGGFCLWRSPT